jgi:ubiquinone/menaquinone biosynthesis C-methylase UbiE
VTHRGVESFEGFLVPFYGSSRPRLFEIERRCMDRDGLVVALLDAELPHARVLDVGAGDGHTAELLNRDGRTVVAMEPDPGMVSRDRRLLWASGIAQDIPFHDDSFDGAYATWAFFLSGMESSVLQVGLDEVSRVVAAGGPMVFIDNAGNDEFSALSSRTIAGGSSWWTDRSFEMRIIESSFRFDSLDEARELLSFYFGEETGRAVDSTEIGFNIAAYIGRSGEVGR